MGNKFQQNECPHIPVQLQELTLDWNKFSSISKTWGVLSWWQWEQYSDSYSSVPINQQSLGYSSQLNGSEKRYIVSSGIAKPISRDNFLWQQTLAELTSSLDKNHRLKGGNKSPFTFIRWWRAYSWVAVGEDLYLGSFHKSESEIFICPVPNTTPKFCECHHTFLLSFFFSCLLHYSDREFSSEKCQGLEQTFFHTLVMRCSQKEIRGAISWFIHLSANAPIHFQQQMYL